MSKNNGMYISKKEILKAKENLKNIIDEMEDEDFLDFAFTLMDICDEQLESEDLSDEMPEDKMYSKIEDNIIEFPKKQRIRQ